MFILFYSFQTVEFFINLHQVVDVPGPKIATACGFGDLSQNSFIELSRRVDGSCSEKGSLDYLVSTDTNSVDFNILCLR